MLQGVLGVCAWVFIVAAFSSEFIDSGGRIQTWVIGNSEGQLILVVAGCGIDNEVDNSIQALDCSIVGGILMDDIL